MFRFAVVSIVWLVCAGAQRAAAGPRGRVEVHIDGDAPFAAGDLVTALDVRLRAHDGPVDVRVRASDDGVAIEVDGGERDVPLGGQSGAAAARLVALAAVDLVLPDLAVEPRDTASVSRHAAAPVAVASRLRLAAFGGAALWGGPGLASGSVDASIPVGRAIVGLDLGLGKLVGGGPAMGSGIDLTASVVRLGLGMRTGPFELRGGLTAAAVRVTDGTGDSTVLFGAGGSVRLYVPVAKGVDAVVVAGADAFATRTEYNQAGMATISTPWFAPWTAVGLAVTR